MGPTIVDNRILGVNWPLVSDRDGNDDYSGSGVDCLLVVLRRLYSHLLNPEDWKKMLTRQEPDSFWLRYSWTRFGGGKESTTAHARNKKAIVRSLDVPPPITSDVPFRILASKSIQLNQYIWGTPMCSLYAPLIKNSRSADWKVLWEEDEQRYINLMSKHSTIEWSGPGPKYPSLNMYIESLFFVKETRADEEIMFLPNDCGRFVRVLYDGSVRQGHGDLEIEQRIKVPTSWTQWDDGWNRFKQRPEPGTCKISQSHSRNFSLVAVVDLRGKPDHHDRVRTYALDGRPFHSPNGLPYSFHWPGPKAVPGHQYMAYYADSGGIPLRVPLGPVHKRDRIMVEEAREREDRGHQPIIRSPSPDPYLGSFVPSSDYYSPPRGRTSSYSHHREDEDGDDDRDVSPSAGGNRHQEQKRRLRSPDADRPSKRIRGNRNSTSIEMPRGRR